MASSASSGAGAVGGSGGGRPRELITKFTNVTVLRNHRLVRDDLWLRGGTIIDPSERFWEASSAGLETAADRVVDGGGMILAPGYIDLQLNGAFGFDFSNPTDMAPVATEEEEDNTTKICRGVLAHGVTSIYATVITSSPATYAQLRPLVKRRQGSAKKGAHILGLHLEGPFITVPGAHPPPLMRPPKGAAAQAPNSPSPSPSPPPGGNGSAPNAGIDGLREVCSVYGSSASDLGWAGEVGIITLAPEIAGVDEVVTTLSAPPHNIVISAGHSKASYSQAVRAVHQGARLVTHLFNAMVSFHHRDPGLIGLIGAPEATKDSPLPKEQGEEEKEKEKAARGSHVVRVAGPSSTLHHPAPPALFYSLIVDGHHTHPASVQIAYSTHPRGAVLVTDAMCAMGLADGTYRFGEIDVEIAENMAHVAGTNTLAGSIATMAQCVQNFRAYTACSVVEALEAASLHPAQCMRLSRKGHLDVGADADLVLLDPDTLEVRATWVMGECAWRGDSSKARISITDTAASAQ